MNVPRLYPILDVNTWTPSELDLVSVAEAMLEGGARILQLRHKNSYSREVYRQAARIAQLCHNAGVLFVVNDRADVALMTGAGLHVGQDDLAACDARRLLGAEGIIGLSTHNLDQLRQALGEPVDYVAIGPVFATQSKQNPDPVVGIDGVKAAAALASLPLVAIGGITRENARDVLESGADSVAIVRDILPETSGLREVRQRMEEWQKLVKN